MADIDRRGDKFSTVLSYENELVVSFRLDALNDLAGPASAQHARIGATGDTGDVRARGGARIGVDDGRGIQG
jgi:hypothetical protein